jgi:S-adenosylmethionine decarboxylase proenzyme
MMHDAKGTHLLLNVSGARRDVLNDIAQVEDILLDAVRATGATVLGIQRFKFEPQGCTVLVALAESHASVHTYPERGVFFADIFTCGDLSPEPAIRVLMRRLGGDTLPQILERVPFKVGA